MERKILKSQLIKQAGQAISGYYKESGLWPTVGEVAKGMGMAVLEDTLVSTAYLMDCANKMFGIYSPANSFALRTTAAFEHFERSVIGEGSNAYYGAKALTNITNAAIGAFQAASGAQLVILGATGELVGGAITTSGIGAAVGVPTMAVSTVAVAAGAVMTGQGVSMVKTSAENFQNNVSKISSDSQAGGGSQGAGNKANPNGTFENAPYHGKNGNSVKSKAPIDGQSALDNSVSIGENTTRRVGVSNGEIVVLDETGNGMFHGHVRSWSDLSNQMKSALIKGGLVDRKGNIIK